MNLLGIDKKPKDTTVVVAMSGGVDSSTVAGIMKNEGYNVIGITLKLYDDAKKNSQSRQCCAGQDILDAKRVANKPEIKHKKLRATLSLFKIPLAFPIMIAIIFPLFIFLPSFVFALKLIFLSEYLKASFAKFKPPIIAD